MHLVTYKDFPERIGLRQADELTKSASAAQLLDFLEVQGTYNPIPIVLVAQIQL